MKLQVTIAVALALVACTPSSVTPSPDADAAPAPRPPATDDVRAACANLRELRCPEGAPGTCEATLAQAKADRLTNLALTCVAGATNGATVRACAPAWATACGP